MDSIEKQKVEIAVQEKELQTKEFLLSFPRYKRYPLITLLILLIPAFFVTKYVTAELYMKKFYKRQITSHEAIVTSLPLSIVETRALRIVGGQYSAYALIKNPNKELVAKELRYTFHFVDPSGKDIKAVEGKTFLTGGQQKYLIIPNVSLSQTPDRVRIEVVPPVWKRRFDVPSITIKNGIPTAHDVQDPSTGFAITGNIQNKSRLVLGEVLISGIVFDKDGQVIAVSQRTENNIRPDEIRDYKLFWPLPLEAQVSGTPLIITETNVLDQDNLR